MDIRKTVWSERFGIHHLMQGLLMMTIAPGANTLSAADALPIVIAHRGASGYLPEHTLAAKALAYGQGADYLEQDVVLTKDDVPIVLHDIHLETVTDVAHKFPERKRADGRYYAIDFTLEEIRTLTVHERTRPGKNQPVYKQRFPLARSRFFVPTLAEEIEMVQGLNQATRKTIGIYPEIKKPAWHRQQGKDISRLVLQVLNQYGYRSKHDACSLQCFDERELKRIRQELDCRLQLIQLIGQNQWGESTTDYDQLQTKKGLKQIAKYADGIGPWLPQVLGRPQHDANHPAPLTSLVQDAHAVGLRVHPYTARQDELPAGYQNFEELHRRLFVDAKVDGLFTDFPDQTRMMRDRLLMNPRK